MQRPAYAAWLRPYARRLRRDATGPEHRLWSRLRGRALGVTFRRQSPVGPYIVDFFAPAAGLVVEVDGRSHADRESADAARQTVLESLGLYVVRVTNDDVLFRLDATVRRIADALAEYTADAR